MSFISNDLPHFLQTYEALNIHIRDYLDDLDNTDKGRSFARFVSKIIPVSRLGNRYIDFEMGPDGKDGGIDLTALSADGSTVLYGQSKLSINKVEEIDTILAKFRNYFEKEHRGKALQLTAFPDLATSAPSKSISKRSSQRTRRGNKALVVDEVAVLPKEAEFVIVTLSNIKSRILPQYEQSYFTSREFYQELKESRKLVILDGPEVLPLVQAAYRKMHIIPSNLHIHFTGPYIQHHNVYIGIIAAIELKEMYHDFGDALFIDNVRLFLGYSSGKRDRENVNDSIRETAENAPQEMLARNNGITFRASRVSVVDGTSLQLEQASIVNGHQTTRCIVDAPNNDSHVLIKIVEVADSWSIAKYANFQTKVDTIALEVAKYMRPQALQQAASSIGITIDHNNQSLFGIFDSIYQDKVRYDEAYYLFIGIFSRSPNNVINKNYTELRSDLLEEFQKHDPKGELIFGLLVALALGANEGRTATEARYKGGKNAEMFQRFWKENKPDYRSLITILAACGSVRMNIYEDSITVGHLERFLSELQKLLNTERDRFVRYYGWAYEAIASYLRITNNGKTMIDIQRTMYDDLKSSDFLVLYDEICMTADDREAGA